MPEGQKLLSADQPIAAVVEDDDHQIDCLAHGCQQLAQGQGQGAVTDARHDRGPGARQGGTYGSGQAESH